MNAEAKYIQQLIVNLQNEGLRFLQRLSNMVVVDSRLPSDVAEWIKDSTSQILPLMPEDISDYDKVIKIKNRYTQSPSILHLSAKEDVRFLIHHLQMARDCANEVFRADTKDIPPQNLANMAYLGLEYVIKEIAATQLIDKLKGREDGVTSNTAMLHIYGKVCMWTKSMARMNRTEDLLALAGSVRAVLELYVDINLFFIEAIPNGAEKYFKYHQVEKWRVANNIVNIRKQLNSLNPQINIPLNTYLNNPVNSQVNIEALRNRLWGTDRNGKPINPKHWSNMDLKTRVDEVADDELSEIYTESYYYCNWLVHSVYTEQLRNLEGVCRLAWHLFELGSKIFLLATELINEWTEVMPEEEFQLLIDKINLKKQKLLFAELVKTDLAKSIPN